MEEIPNDVDDGIPILRLMLREKKIKLEDERGIIKVYTLRELKGPKREEFIDLVTSRSSVDSKGKPHVRSYSGLETKLISMMMFDEDGKPVPERDMLHWPGSTQAEIALMCQELSALDNAAMERQKKD